MNLIDILKCAKDNDASDIHLIAGHPPVMRVHTVMTAMDLPVLTNEDCLKFLTQMAPKEAQERFVSNKDADFSFFADGLARYRVNVHMQRSKLAFAMRIVKTKVPPLENLNLPEVITRLTYLPRGLVLVTGDTGSGKSTTLAAMIQAMNERYAKHIITLEDPVEYTFNSNKCLIEQRELGSDMPSFASALKHALRQDPDIILVGEMRDLETTQLAITAAETGHLVLGTLHTSSASQTVDRMVDVFPATQQTQIRVQLSSSLVGVFSQTLCRSASPRSGSLGRVMAQEIMVNTPAIANLIREGKTAQLYSQIQTGAQAGMQTLERALANLVRNGKVSAAEALTKTSRPDELERLLDQS